MRVRWILAAVAALALATLTLAVPMPWLSHRAKVAVGNSCPADAKTANLDFTMKDVNGTDVRLSDYKGKLILLDFWATWCGPCKFEIPAFVSLQKKYAKDGLQVLGVSVDDELEKLQPFVKEFGMNYPVLQGKGHDDVQDAFGPMIGIPVNVLISPEGKICVKHTGLPPTHSKEGSLQEAVEATFEAEIKALLPNQKT